MACDACAAIVAIAPCSSSLGPGGSNDRCTKPIDPDSLRSGTVIHTSAGASSSIACG